MGSQSERQGRGSMSWVVSGGFSEEVTSPVVTRSKPGPRSQTRVPEGVHNLCKGRRAWIEPRSRSVWPRVSCLYSWAAQKSWPTSSPAFLLVRVRGGKVGTLREGSGTWHLRVCLRRGHHFDTSAERACTPALQDPLALPGSCLLVCHS